MPIFNDQNFNVTLPNGTEQNRTKLYLAKLRPYIWRKSTMHATYMNKGTKETKEKIKLYTGFRVRN